MKNRLFPSIALFCVFSIISTTSYSQIVAKVPPWTVKANGNPFGVFVSISGDQEVTIQLTDPVTSVSYSMEIDRQAGVTFLQSSNGGHVFYSLANCTGIVYITAPFSALEALLGVTYGYGPDPANGNNLTVFKNTGSSFPVLPPTASVYRRGECSNTALTAVDFGFASLFPSVVVEDITTNHPPPYTIE